MKMIMACLTAFCVFFNVLNCYGASDGLVCDRNIKTFTNAFFKKPCLYVFEKDEKSITEEPSIANVSTFEKTGLRVSKNNKYAISLRRLGLNYFIKNRKISIQRTEPDSFVDLCRIEGDRLYLVSTLVSIGTVGVVCNAYWYAADVVAVLSIVEGSGFITLFDLRENKKTIFKIDSKYYLGFPYDSKMFSNYYQKAFKTDYKILFQQLDAVYF